VNAGTTNAETETVTGSEVFSPFSGIDQPLFSSGSLWLHCGTSSSAAIPDDWLGICALNGAIWGNNPTDAGRHGLEETSQAQQLIREIREISGLTWTQLALVFDVDRRSLHFWTNGAAPTEHNATRLRHVAEVIRLHDQGNPKLTKKALTSSSSDGQSVVDMLALQRYAAAEAAAATPVDRPQTQVRKRKRPPRLSADIRAQRRAYEPEELLGAAPSDEYDHGRFLTSFSL